VKTPTGLVKALPLLHSYTVPLRWETVFFKHSPSGRQRHGVSVQGELRAPLLSGPQENRRSCRQLRLTQPAGMLNCHTTERILICSNGVGVFQAASPAGVNHGSPPEINAITPIFIDS